MRNTRVLGAVAGLVMFARSAPAAAADAGIADAAADSGGDAGAGPWIEETDPFEGSSVYGEDCVTGLAFAGTQALAGDPCFDTTGTSTSNQQGSVYVLARQGDRWVASGQNLIATDGALYDNLGTAVAADGDTAIFGAPSAGRVLSPMGNVEPHGAAWIFVRTGGVWTQAQKLLAPDGVAGDYFGNGVAISKDTIAIGAPRRNIGSVPSEGTVYVYVRSGNQWSLQQEIVLPQLAPDAGPDSDEFGNAIALDGDTLIAGTDQRRVDGNRFQGSVFVYVRSGATWSLQQQVVLAAGAAGDHLGASVALQGDRAMVGAIGSMGGLGTAYPFTRTGTVWSEGPHLPPTGLPQDHLSFGLTLAMDGDLVLLGAPESTTRYVFDEGIVAAFARTAAGWQMEQLLLPAIEDSESLFGRNLAVAGTHALIVGSKLHAYTRVGPVLGGDGGALVDTDGGVDATGDAGTAGGGSSSSGASSGGAQACDAGDCADSASPVPSSGGCGCRVGPGDRRSWAYGATLLVALFALRRRSRR